MLWYVVTYFWVPALKRRKYKKYIYIYMFEKKSKNNNNENRMPERPENGQKLVEEVLKYKD
jgi:hypothetical protein